MPEEKPGRHSGQPNNKYYSIAKPSQKPMNFNTPQVVQAGTTNDDEGNDALYKLPCNLE